MGVSKVNYNNTTLIDISGDTVTPQTLVQGATAHNANGEQIVGTMIPGFSVEHVPINDIYNVFKSYWNAGGFTYASADDDGYRKKTDGTFDTTITSKAGRRNGMWFYSDTKVQTYNFGKDKNDNDRIGKPINCSTIASLVTLGIPYSESKYNKSLSSYNISSISGVQNSFSLYGDGVIINADNYDAYFLTPRMLSGYAEQGLEVTALRYDWKAKDTESGSWYDIIAPTSDLREARPGDLIFWNNGGNLGKLDPRDVTHVVLVLDRISYDSSNPEQPLLLLAEATEFSSTGIQVSYYMYDDRSLITFTENAGGGYIQLNKSIADETVSKYLYSQTEDGYVKDAACGTYLKIGVDTYVEILNNQYIRNNDSVRAVRYNSVGTTYSQSSTGALVKCYSDDVAGYISLTTATVDGVVSVVKYASSKIEGTNEHKIPKFICRPKYKRLVNSAYSDISETEDYSEAEITATSATETTAKVKKITFTDADATSGKKDVYTLEFDWTTQTGSGHYLSIRTSDKEAFRHYIPNCMGGTTYKKVKIVVPINAAISTSKQNELGNMGADIRLQEVYVDGNKASQVAIPSIANLNVYKGIRLGESSASSISYRLTESDKNEIAQRATADVEERFAEFEELLGDVETLLASI